MKNENVEGKKQARRSKFNDGLEKCSYVVSSYLFLNLFYLFIFLNKLYNREMATVAVGFVEYK
jgi:hypothetical protein